MTRLTALVAAVGRAVPALSTRRRRIGQPSPSSRGLRNRLSSGLLLCCISLCCTALAQPGTPSCEALLFNNPAASLEAYHPVVGQQFTLEGFPSIWVRLSGLPSDEEAVLRVTAVDATGTALAAESTELTPEAGAASWRWRLGEPLTAPAGLQVEVTQGAEAWTYREQVRLHRLSGRITDFEGKPRAGYVMALGYDGLLVKANADGAYELWVPETPLPAVVVLDETWGKTTVETWIYDWYPRHDVALDPRLGEVEVYELHAWRGASGLKVDFIPMSVGLINRLLNTVGREKLNDYFGVISDAKPYLNREGVTVELNGKPLEVRGFDTRADQLQRLEGGAENGRPEYTLQLTDLPRDGAPGETQLLRVTARRTYIEDGKLVEEQGESYYLGLRAHWWATTARLP